MSQLPPKPPFPPEPEETQRGASWISIFLATMLVLGAIGALFFLTNGVLGGVIVVGGVVFAVTALHYFVWGRWLEKLIRESQDPDDET
jgi:hypothetical protein